MTFELDSLTKVRVLDVRTLSSKDRKPGDPVGSQLLLRTTLSSGALAMFDGFLPGMLYRKPIAKKQGEIDGFESAELTQIGDHVKRMPWQYEQTGCEVVIDFGTGGPSNIKLGDCKAHRVSISPRQGGSVDVQWTLDAPALSTDTRGKLTDLKSTDIQMTLEGPTVADDPQQEIEAKGGPQPDGSWPFPKDPKGGAAPPQSVTTEKAKGKKTGNEAGDAFAKAHPAH